MSKIRISYPHGTSRTVQNIKALRSALGTGLRETKLDIYDVAAPVNRDTATTGMRAAGTVDYEVPSYESPDEIVSLLRRDVHFDGTVEIIRDDADFDRDRRVRRLAFAIARGEFETQWLQGLIDMDMDHEHEIRDAIAFEADNR